MISDLMSQRRNLLYDAAIFFHVFPDDKKGGANMLRFKIFCEVQRPWSGGWEWLVGLSRSIVVCETQSLFGPFGPFVWYGTWLPHARAPTDYLVEYTLFSMEGRRGCGG